MILVVGILSIVAGVLYTGGPRPYGYAGLGEVFVFLFFGLVAVNGSYYVQLEEARRSLPLGLSIAVGFLATAILVVNNVRDIETDRRAGKSTLAVRIGRERTPPPLRGPARRRLRRPAVAAIAANSGPGGPPLGLLSLPLAAKPARAVLTRTDGPALNGALAGTGALLACSACSCPAGLLIAA